MNGASGRTSKLPDGKLLIPGVVSHATNIVEHPQVVADRIVRYAKVVGRENVIAGTDCGFGGRIHPQIAWAKLEALAAGRQARDRGALALGDGPIKGTQPPPFPRSGIGSLLQTLVAAFADSGMRGADPSRSDLLQSKYALSRRARERAVTLRRQARVICRQGIR